jgi:hypothetical protein
MALSPEVIAASSIDLWTWDIFKMGALLGAFVI